MKKVLLVGSNSLRAPYPVTPVGLCLVAVALAPDWQVRIFDPLAEGADLAAAVRSSPRTTSASGYATSTTS